MAVGWTWTKGIIIILFGCSPFDQWKMEEHKDSYNAKFYTALSLISWQGFSVTNAISFITFFTMSFQSRPDSLSRSLGLIVYARSSVHASCHWCLKISSHREVVIVDGMSLLVLTTANNKNVKYMLGCALRSIRCYWPGSIVLLEHVHVV